VKDEGKPSIVGFRKREFVAEVKKKMKSVGSRIGGIKGYTIWV